MSTVRNIAMVWNAVIFFALPFIAMYVIVPAFFRSDPSFLVSMGAGSLALLIRFA